MYEYEFWDRESNEHYIFFGYNLDDVKKRHPEVDFSKLVFIGRDYID